MTSSSPRQGWGRLSGEGEPGELEVFAAGWTAWVFLGESTGLGLFLDPMGRYQKATYFLLFSGGRP